MPIIRRVTLKNFKRYENVSFDIPGHLVLAGPNNTGKTTLDEYKLVGGGFAFGCNAAPGAADLGGTGGFLASLLGLLGLRSRRRKSADEAKA